MRLILLLAVLALAQCLFAQSLEILGARWVRNPSQYGSVGERYDNFIDRGGNLHVYFRNTGAEPIKIDAMHIDGTAFKDLPKIRFFANRYESTMWELTYPNPIPPGAVGVFLARLEPYQHFEGKRTLTFQTSAGVVRAEADLTTLPVRLAHVGFDEALQQVTLFVRNSSAMTLAIPTTGFLRLNGQDMSARAQLPTRQVKAGEVLPMTVTLPQALQPGDTLIAQVRLGQYWANGWLRAFPSFLAMGMWWDSGGVSPQELVDYNNTMDMALNPKTAAQYGIRPFVFGCDEPMGGGQSPEKIAEEAFKLMTGRAKTLPVCSQQTQMEEIGYYTDMVDFNFTHRDVKRQVGYLAQIVEPKPFWYLPQSVWQFRGFGDDEEMYNRPDRWYQRSDQIYYGLLSIACGAKGLNWFQYGTLWDQGNGFGGGTDLFFMRPRLYQEGVPGNPELLDEVGRVNGYVLCLEPVLARSAQIDQQMLPDHITLSRLQGDRHTLIAVMVAPTGRPRINVPVKLTVPSWVDSKQVFVLDYDRGVIDRPCKVEPGAVTVTLDYIEPGAVIVVGADAATRKEIEGIWRKRMARFGSRFPLREDRADEPPVWTAGAWHQQDRHYRVPFTVHLPADVPAGGWLEAKIDVDHALDKLGPIDPASFVIIGPDGKPCPTYSQYQMVYEEFGPGAEARWKMNYDLADLTFADGQMRYSVRYPSAGNGWFGLYKKTDGEYGTGFFHRPGVGGGSGWVSAEYPIVQFRYKLDNPVHTVTVMVDYDLKGDKRRDQGSGFQLFYSPPSLYMTEDGWRVTEFNWVRGGQNQFTATPKHASVAINQGVQKYAAERPNTITVDEIIFTGNTTMRWQNAKALKAGSTYTGWLYYDVKPNNVTPTPAVAQAPADVVTATAKSGRIESPLPKLSMRVIKDKSGDRLKLYAVSPAPLALSVANIYDAEGRAQARAVLETTNGRVFTGLVPIKSGSYAVHLRSWTPAQTMNFVSQGPWLDAQPKPPQRVPAWTLDCGWMVRDVAFDPHHQALLVGGDELVSVGTDGALRWRVRPENDGKIHRLACASGAPVIAAAINNWLQKGNRWTGSLSFFQAADGGKGSEKAFERYISSVHLMPDGKRAHFLRYHLPVREQDPHNVRSLNADGTEGWLANVAGAYPHALAIDTERGCVIAGGATREIIYAFDLASGKRLWAYSSQEPGENMVARVASTDAGVYAATFAILALDHQGKLRWRKPCGNRVRALAANAAGTTVVGLSINGCLTAYDADGNLRWERFEQGAMGMDARVLADGRVLVLFDQLNYTERAGWKHHGRLQCIDPKGNVQWEARISRRHARDYLSMAVSADESLLAVGSTGHTVSVFPLRGQGANATRKLRLPRVATQQADPGTVEGFFLQMRDAIESQNVDTLLALYAEDYTGLDESIHGVRQTYQQIFQYADMPTVEYEIVKSEVDGDKAIVTLKYRFPGWGQIRYELVRRDGRWLILKAQR
jgi:hypothetical protein